MYDLQLRQTTKAQLGLIKEVLVKEARAVHSLWITAQNEADCTDQIDYDLDNLHAALENILSDMEVLPPRVCQRRDYKVDNRDESTTWLWFSDREYLEVDPIELYNNMLENLPWYDVLVALKREVMVGNSGWDDVRDWGPEDYKARLNVVVGWEDAEQIHQYVQAHYFDTQTD